MDFASNGLEMLKTIPLEWRTSIAEWANEVYMKLKIRWKMIQVQETRIKHDKIDMVQFIAQ